MNADEERLRIARLKYCTAYERTPWKTFLCCALGRTRAFGYIDEFTHLVEDILAEETRAGVELWDTGLWDYKTDEEALTGVVNPSVPTAVRDPHLQWCAGHRLSFSEANHAAVEKQRRARDMDIIASQTLNPKPRVSRAVIGVVLALILATTLAASSGLGLDAAAVVAEMAAACGLTEANVRWFIRVIVVGGTMGISGAVYCALTFGIATGVVYLLFRGRS
jgi:hypothetical protein